MHSIEHYLTRYGEQESQWLNTFPALTFNGCVVIPARDESADFLHRFVRDFAKGPANRLLVLVINQPCDQINTQHNQALYTAAQTIFSQKLWQQNSLSLHANNNAYLLIVDRFSQQTIPTKQGVGLARKIGGDIACQLFQQGHIASPIILSSDADAYLPLNYFEACTLKKDKTVSALVFDFKHSLHDNTASNACLEATQLYEQALKYFQQALHYAGSPYAFYTLGSTLAFSVEHYAQARGFPKRSGGEDFYLLNKLAKVGEVRFCPNICIDIAARESHRVPFGTGPAIEKIMQLDNPTTDYCYYNATLFSLLKIWLNSTQQFWHLLQSGEDPLNTLPNHINAAAQAIKAPAFFLHAQKHCKTAAAFSKQFHQWFDAFVTLKFIHALQDMGYTPQPLASAINDLQQLNQDTPHD